MAEPANTRAHRDRIRQRVGAARKQIETVRRIVNEYRDGRAASACMADIAVALGKDRRDG